MSKRSHAVHLGPDTPIDALDLPARVVNVLRRADIRHLGELVLLREAAFSTLRGAHRSDWPAVDAAQHRSGLDAAIVPIMYLPVPASLATMLIHQGIRCVGELVALSDADVRGLRGISAGEVRILLDALARFGLELRQESA